MNSLRLNSKKLLMFDTNIFEIVFSHKFNIMKRTIFFDSSLTKTLAASSKYS